MAAYDNTSSCCRSENHQQRLLVETLSSRTARGCNEGGLPPGHLTASLLIKIHQKLGADECAVVWRDLEGTGVASELLAGSFTVAVSQLAGLGHAEGQMLNGQDLCPWLPMYWPPVRRIGHTQTAAA
eukprot:635118-Pelagomonas_calceolata.AAC.6